ncbi:CHAT domain-containing protein [Microcoleus sp. herbarium8]|uniref:CHAT domain-containing protein n=1 Tax=Microcoleus sp. herbarium8 TaxID=3055436 RepID=UPI002FD05042
MDENRTQAYINLIQSLLSCPGGEEPQILKANLELLDLGFLQVCEGVATQLAKAGNENGADFLRNIASQIGELLGMNKEADRDSLEDENYQNYILELLQTEQDSEGDVAVIYPMLAKRQHLLNERFAEILKQVIENLIANKHPEVIESILTNLENLSIDIKNFPSEKRGDNIEIALIGFKLILNKRELGSKKYAETQNNLGNAYRERIKGEKADNLEDAIAFYQNALEVRTREAFPKDWAMTKSNLATAYNQKIRGERADNLEDAIESYTAALQVLTREGFSEYWATTQQNLAVAYRNRIRGDRADNLEKAIASYIAALEVLTREAFREKWAGTQQNLAAAYHDRIKGERADNLEKAIAFYTASLEVLSREAFPQDWATTQHNLATAYCERIKGEKADNLEKAIAFYTAALQVRTREAFSEYWAMTQHNLAAAYHDRIRGERADNLENAITFYTAALEVRTRKAFPQDWAMTQNNLANAYLNRIIGERADNLENAIKFYRNALEVRTREAFPQSYAQTLFNLGRTYREVPNLQLAHDTFADAINTVESLRGEIHSGDETKQKLAEVYNRIYLNIVEVCIQLNNYIEAIEYAERSKARNLVELLANKDIYPKHEFYPNLELYQTHCHQLEQLRRQIPAKQRELEILISSRESEERYRNEIEQRRQELTQQQQQRDELLAEINHLDSSFAFTQKVEPISFGDIQKLLPDNQTAIIQWYILGDRFLTFIITQSSVPKLWQSEPADLQALNHWFDEYLQDYDRPLKTHWRDNLESRLHQLAEILHLEDILKRVPDNCQQVILIPHRLLHLLPLHAMPLPNQQDKCLLDKFPKGVRYAPSCQLLQLSQKQERPYLTHLFGIQNPTQDLTYASLQVQTICQHFDSAQVLVETAATKAALINNNDRAKPLRSAHCLHFACHGDFNEKSPLESYLKLANNELLSLGEIFSLDINQCRLVTLSACETGLTDHTSISDEYIGLPSGFLFSGSPSVVSSLWKVDELATAFLMIKFYENLRKGEKGEAGNVAIALKDAKIWLRDLTHQDFEKCLDEFMPQIEEILAKLSKGKRLIAESSLKQVRDRQPRPFASPYYWAGFIATGR